MTKEIKRTGEKDLQQRSKTVDSLYNLIQISRNQSNDLLIKEFASKKEDLETFTNDFYREQSLKIWARIKDYSTKFSEDNKYEMVLGSQQGENIIYGNASRDVSDAFIIYINERYEGNR